jgi:hypothetical protein
MKLMQTTQVMELKSKHAENKKHGNNKKTNNNKISKINDLEYERIKEFI